MISSERRDEPDAGNRKAEPAIDRLEQHDRDVDSDCERGEEDEAPEEVGDESPRHQVVEAKTTVSTSSGNPSRRHAAMSTGEVGDVGEAGGGKQARADRRSTAALTEQHHGLAARLVRACGQRVDRAARASNRRRDRSAIPGSHRTSTTAAPALICAATSAWLDVPRGHHLRHLRVPRGHGVGAEPAGDAIQADHRQFGRWRAAPVLHHRPRPAGTGRDRTAAPNRRTRRTRASTEC